MTNGKEKKGKKKSFTDSPIFKKAKEYSELIKVVMYFGGLGLALYGVFATKTELKAMGCDIEKNYKKEVLELKSIFLEDNKLKVLESKNNLLKECSANNSCSNDIIKASNVLQDDAKELDEEIKSNKDKIDKITSGINC